MTRLPVRVLLPNATDVTRSVITQTINNRRVGSDTVMSLGSPRQIAKRVLNPGGYQPIVLVESTSLSNSTDVTYAASRAVRGGHGSR